MNNPKPQIKSILSINADFSTVFSPAKIYQKNFMEKMEKKWKKWKKNRKKWKKNGKNGKKMEKNRYKTEKK